MYTAEERLHIYKFIANINRNHGIWHFLFDKDYLKDNGDKIIFKFILSQTEYKFDDIVKKRLSFEKLLSMEGIHASFDWCVDVNYHADREEDGKKKRYSIFILRPYDGEI